MGQVQRPLVHGVKVNGNMALITDTQSSWTGNGHHFFQT